MYRNSSKEMTVFGTKKLDMEFYCKIMKVILKPEIMLYDEPTTGLDPITGKEISNLINSIKKKYQTSSIIITHDMSCAEIVADRILVLIDGVCHAQGTFNELKNSKDEKVRQFFI
jgi:phospholipid/cholesterol/gamma-HCH transport system ATP-binding protein